MDFFSALEVSASGLAAERTRINVASSNLANVNTTRGAGGGAYQRQDVLLSARPVGEEADDGLFRVQVDGVQGDPAPPRMEYDPGHPDANPDGYVAYPNVNVVEEMVDMITASRAYQAGLTALNTAVALAERALAIGK